MYQFVQFYFKVIFFPFDSKLTNTLECKVIPGDLKIFSPVLIIQSFAGFFLVYLELITSEQKLDVTSIFTFGYQYNFIYSIIY